MAIKTEKQPQKITILPWIKNREYLDPTYQKQIEELREKLSETGTADGVTWYPNGRAVI